MKRTPLSRGTGFLRRGTRLKGGRSTPSPTPADVERFQRIYEIGCLTCLPKFRECQVQHLLSGGIRRGHQFTIGLCPWCHVGEPPDGMTNQQARWELGPSLHHTPRLFRETYGTDEELLARQDALLAERFP